MVTGINDGIHRMGEQARPILRGYKIINRNNLAAWMNAGNTLLHGQHLGLANGGRKRMNLAVDIGWRNMVHINQRQPPYTTAGQGLGGP